MSAYSLAACLAYAVIFLIAGFLVLHHDYEDGLIGRVALSGMSFIGIVRVCQISVEGLPHPTPAGVLFIVLVAVFMARHCYRFLRWRRTGAHSWREARK